MGLLFWRIVSVPNYLFSLLPIPACCLSYLALLQVGTVYCVAVPIKRVKPEARIALNEAGDIEGLTFEYDPEDPNSDPSSQFPFGT
jgi:hypothetical protein